MGHIQNMGHIQKIRQHLTKVKKFTHIDNILFIFAKNVATNLFSFYLEIITIHR